MLRFTHLPLRRNLGSIFCLSQIVERRLDNSEKSNDYLFGEGEKVLFKDLGACEKLVQALHDVHMSTATSIQALSFKPIMSKKDCVVGAETGSGKTLSYLAPIINGILVDGVASLYYPTVVIMVSCFCPSAFNN